MARPIWNGMLTFGLLNVPVQLYSAEKSVDLHFRLLDSRDRNPIRYERINAEIGEEVPWKEIVKAFEYSIQRTTAPVSGQSLVERDTGKPVWVEPRYVVEA